MQNNPEEMTLAKLDVLVMPNGEILCEGHSLGFVSTLGKQLSQFRDAITGEEIENA